MSEIMKNRINEEKIELAKRAIARGDLSLEDIAITLDLPLELVRALNNPIDQIIEPPDGDDEMIINHVVWR